ncbi:ENPP6-like protein [Mya arenaria]|uniref:glycerophosphocholine cholinephosphodiesterase n=1 Tax=Mya arenaria TaxID=6604 RepID=A0ABY7DEI2_MYAAR|nr:ENPP6-like protein [Mya arenaria]
MISSKTMCNLRVLTLVFFSFVVPSTGSKLLFFLVDGFRWDYFDLPGVQTDGFRRLFESGSRAEWLVPDFPTNSFPNYKTLETGLHVEQHGFVGNYMWDEAQDRHFELPLVRASSLHLDWWEAAQPFYITAQLQGIRAGLFNVRACNLSINGVAPSYCDEFLLDRKSPELRILLDTAMESLLNDTLDVACW